MIRTTQLLLFSLFLVFPAFDSVAQDAHEKVKVSAFAPVKATEAELKYFVTKIGKDLEDKEDYGEDQHKRIVLDTSTVSVLALTLAMHDKDNAYKQAAGKIVELAIEVGENAEDFDDATSSYEKLKKSLDEKPKSESLDWHASVADIDALMRQVPIVNDKVRRGVNDKRRFDRNAKKVAQKAVTLAAIAQVSMMNTDYCGDEDDEKAWQKICADMRDACADVYRALMEKDQDKAKAGNARVVETCDACHHRFRD